MKNCKLRTKSIMTLAPCHNLKRNVCCLQFSLFSDKLECLSHNCPGLIFAMEPTKVLHSHTRVITWSKHARLVLKVCMCNKHSSLLLKKVNCAIKFYRNLVLLWGEKKSTHRDRSYEDLYTSYFMRVISKLGQCFLALLRLWSFKTS
jgi:hypothetical protein